MTNRWITLEEVRTAAVAGELEAIEASLRHWRELAASNADELLAAFHSGQTDLGMDRCALCERHRNRSHKEECQRHGECPLKTTGSWCLKRESPYDNAYWAFTLLFKVDQSKNDWLLEHVAVGAWNDDRGARRGAKAGTRAREKEMSTSHYDRSYSAFSPDALAGNRTSVARYFRYSFVRRHVRPDDDVLDVGCGRDWPALRALSGGRGPGFNTYTGVDLNRVRPSNRADVTLLGEFNFCARWRELRRYAPFTAVLALEVLEHVPEDEAGELLGAVRSLTEPDASLLLSTPVAGGGKALDTHVREYSAEETANLLRVAGFEVEGTWGTICRQRDLRRVPEAAAVLDRLREYHDSNVLACLLAPLVDPAVARGCLYRARRLP